MRTRLRVWAPPARVENEFGEVIADGWRDLGTIRAERVKMTGRSIRETGEVFAAYDAEYHVRITHAIEVGYKVRECRHSPVMRVDNIIPWHDKGMLTLQCHKLNA